MKQRLLSVILLCVLFIGVANAQERQVSGKVTSAADGSSLGGVSVRVDGTNTATQTDGSGNYTISVSNQNATLVFSYIGYATQRTAVGTQSTVNVQLTSSDNELEEVIVTALGVKREKRELGYSADQVDSKTVNKASAVNIANGLQGKVSGLNVTTNNSGVFEDVKINLRGIRSLTGNNNPLLVLDGVQMDIKYLSSLNPNDVENVSVLKGAAAAAIYGPDARNGVILVTTKKGSDVTSINVSHSTQWQNISFFPELQKQFGQGYDDQIDPIENWSWGPAYDGKIVDIGPKLPDGSQQTTPYTGTDERQKFYNTGVTNQTNVSLNAKDFFLSLENADIKGIVPGDKNRRNSIRLNSQREFGMLRAGANFNYSQQNYNVYDQIGQQDYFTAQGTGGNDGLFNQLINTPAHILLTKYKNYKTDKFSTYENWFTNYGLNPYFSVGNWRKNGKKQDLISNIELGLKPADWLDFTYRASINSRNIAERYITEGVKTSQWGENRGKTSITPALEEYNYNQTILTSELFGSVNKQINDDLKFSGILGTFVRQNEYRNTSVGAGNLVIPELQNIGIRVGNLTGESNGYKTRLFSVYGSAGFNYKNWANVEFTGRWDKSSTLAPGNNSYFYPGVNGAIVLSDALDMSSDFFNYLKVRGAWTKTANSDISPYFLEATYSQANGFPLGAVTGLTANNTTYDYNLKPERINTTEAGFEAGFWNNRLTVEATYFFSKNTDQIISVNISEASGFSRSYRNAASFNSKGVDFDFNLSPLIKFNDGGINFRGNFLWNDSEVTSIYEAQKLKELSLGGYVAAGNYAIVGQPAFIMRGTDYARDDQGRVIVSAEDGRPSVSGTPVNLGRTLPKWIIGLNPSVNYKNFNLSALFEYKGGHVASFFGLGGDMAWTGVSIATAYNDRQPFILPNSVIEDPNNPGKYIPNTDAKIGANESIYNYYTGEFGDAASNFVVSANQWRLRELSLSYDVPQEWLTSRQKAFKGLSIAFVGRNLALWLPKENKFMDPDFDSMSTDNDNAFGNINSTANPPVRNFGFTINAKF
ncbi:SusC/RagA family TonB-linked outer membrane protein [Sphingobacterium endophyticum]|uniref:SusC/RagA family TonB-linked outer membrane protein n=1 Tax=Sphingobacterium endophyticum TaxID=2546448 RepID=UPI0012E1233F|nr:SusC/RagA family TonB-linked outer membrane protein [Sphingobacterium endophyticum]